MPEEAFLFPTSFAQQRLWFLEQLAPANPFYNVFQAVRFRQAVDLGVLERSLNEIVRRHEALRTRFVAVEGQPMQVILSSLSLLVGQVDLRGLGPAAREAEAQRLAGEEARRPFVLSEGPLLRATLVRLAEADWLLLLGIDVNRCPCCGQQTLQRTLLLPVRHGRPVTVSTPPKGDDTS